MNRSSLDLPRNGTIDLDVYYRNVETGERWVVQTEAVGYMEDGVFEDFWWSEGSMGCDCNRSAGHGEYPCNTGENRVMIEKITPRGRADVVLYSEEKS